MATPAELFGSDTDQATATPGELFASAPAMPSELFGGSEAQPFNPADYTPEQLAAEETRKKTGKRMDFTPTGEGSTTGEYLSDLMIGAKKADASLVPFTSRRENPAFDMSGPLPFVANMAGGAVRSTAAALGGTAAALGNPLAGAAALVADRVIQIEDELPGGIEQTAKEHPIATGVDLVATGATNLFPGGQAVKQGLGAILRPAVRDAGIGAVQGGATAIEEGADFRTPEGRSQILKAAALGAAPGAAIGAAKIARTKIPSIAKKQILEAQPNPQEGGDAIVSRTGETEGQAAGTGPINEAPPPTGVGSKVIRSSPGAEMSQGTDASAFYPQSVVGEPIGMPKESGKHQLKFLRSPEREGQALNDLNAGAKQVEAQRRGAMPDALVAKKAAQAGMTIEKIRKIKPGQLISPEQNEAVKGIYEQASRKSDELQTKIDASKDFDEGLHNQWRQANRDMFDALRVAIGQGTEYGRGLRLMGKILDVKDLNYDAKTGQPKFDSRFKQTAAKTLQKRVFGDQEIPQSIVDEFSAAKTPEEIATILTREARLRLKTTPLEAAANVIKAGMLTGIKTQARNFGGQVAKGLGLQQAENTISGLVDWAMSKRTGQRTTVTPGLGTLKDIKSGAVQGFKEGVDLVRGKAAPEIEKVLDRLDIAVGQNTGLKPLDAYVNTIFRIQGAADLPFRRFQWINSIRQQAEVQAKNEVISGTLKKADIAKRTAQIMESPTPEMAHNATVYAEEATYAQPNAAANWLGSGIRKAKQSKYGFARAAGTIADVGVLPFRKTPFNIAKDMIDHTFAPVALAAKSPGVIKKMWDKSITPEEQKAFAKLVAQAGTGAGAYFLGALLASKGLMTGSSEDESSGQRGASTAVGRQAGAIKLNGEWRRVSEAASPVSNLMVMGASIYREATKPLETEAKRAGNLAESAFNTIAETPYFQGIQRIADLKKDRGIERFVGGIASASVPTLVSDVGGLTDKYRREARPAPDEGFLTGVSNQVKSRLPYLRTKLPPRITAFGDKEQERAVNMFDPTFPKKALEDSDPVSKAIVDYNISLTAPKRRDGETQEAFEERAKKRGDKVRMIIQATINDGQFLSQPDPGKYLQSKVDAAIR